MIGRRTAIKNDLFAGERKAEKADRFGDPLQKMAAIVDFRALARGGADCSLAGTVERWPPSFGQARGSFAMGMMVLG